MFWEKIFLNRMMEFQVKICHHSGLRLWWTGVLFSTKSKCHKSNVCISSMKRNSFYNLKVHFWWPNMCSKHQVLRLNTLYGKNGIIPWHFFLILRWAFRGCWGQMTSDNEILRLRPGKFEIVTESLAPHLKR